MYFKFKLGKSLSNISNVLNNCPVASHTLPLPEAAADDEPDGEEEDGRGDANRGEGGFYISTTVSTTGTEIQCMI